MKKVSVIILLLQITSIGTIFSQSYFSVKKSQRYHPDSVEYLKISRKKLSYLPSLIWSFKNLKGLDVSKNNLTSIPDSIVILKDLEVLNLSKNRLLLFPKELFKCKKLKQLNLSSNQIGVIPQEVAQCSELRQLDLYIELNTKRVEMHAKTPLCKWLDCKSKEAISPWFGLNIFY